MRSCNITEVAKLQNIFLYKDLENTKIGDKDHAHCCHVVVIPNDKMADGEFNVDSIISRLLEGNSGYITAKSQLFILVMPDLQAMQSSCQMLLHSIVWIHYIIRIVFSYKEEATALPPTVSLSLIANATGTARDTAAVLLSPGEHKRHHHNQARSNLKSDL